MKHLILNNGKFFIKSFLISGLIIPHFGDIADAKRFDSRDEAKAALSNDSNCIIARDIWSIN